MTRLLAAVVLVALALAPAPARAGDLKGMAAYEAGRYAEAYAEFKLLAEQGLPETEFMMGVMFFYGRGVAKNAAFAAVWFHKAARQGNRTAQLALGSLHIRGLGVYRDLEAAFAWLSLAAQSDAPGLAQQAVSLRDDTEKLMTPVEIARARRRAADFTPVAAGLTWDR